MKAHVYLLLRLQEASDVICVQVVFVVAVGEHKEVQISAGRHHLVEGAELLEPQSSLFVICVCLLQQSYSEVVIPPV